MFLSTIKQQFYVNPVLILGLRYTFLRFNNKWQISLSKDNGRTIWLINTILFKRNNFSYSTTCWNINSNNAFSIGVKQTSLKCSISFSVRNFGILFPCLGSLIFAPVFLGICPSSCDQRNIDLMNRIRWAKLDGFRCSLDFAKYSFNWSVVTDSIFTSLKCWISSLDWSLYAFNVWGENPSILLSDS